MFARMSIGLAPLCLMMALQPVFENMTPTSRIDFRHENSPTPEKYLLETMGGGVAVLDYDNDGDLDVFFTNGASVSASGAEREWKHSNRLYRNDGDWKFTDVTQRAGLTGNALGYGMGVAVGDFDNDGYEDLYLTNYGGNALYRNQGDGTFLDVTSRAGVAASGWSTSAGFFDYNNDGELDIFVCRYLDWTFRKNIFCGERKRGQRAYCHPDNFQGITNVLFKNNGDGTFTDVSLEAGVANPDGKALGVAFADYDDDGWTDIYVANDSVMCFLYRNQGNGKFEEAGLTAGVGYNEDGKPFAGMGVDFADYDNDGKPDIVVTNLSQERYALFRNAGGGQFQYASGVTGVGHASFPFSGWGVKMLDYDNDGRKDLFAAQGHVLDTIGLTSPNIQYAQPPLLLRNESKRFIRVSAASAGAAFSQPRPGRGAAFGDMDNDGDVDVIIANVGQAPTILKNNSEKRNRWLMLRLEGVRANRDGIGCRLRLVMPSGETQIYEVHTASGYLSASDRRVTIGLGSTAVVPRIDIRWPSGRIQTLTSVKSGQILVVREPAA